MPRHGYRGLNITYPYKQAIIAYLDVLSPNAEAVGSVNTVVFREGRRSGHNTDLWGFAERSRRSWATSARNRSCCSVPGGAGAAVAHALLECGVGRLLISDPEAPRARARGAAAASVRRRTGGRRRMRPPTPRRRGRHGQRHARRHGSPAGDADRQPTRSDPAMWVADIIYFPIETEFLRAARAKAAAR